MPQMSRTPAPTQASGLNWQALLPSGRRWYARLPYRLWFTVRLVVAPFQTAGWLIDKTMGLIAIALLVVFAAWYSHHIPDSVVSGVMLEVGNRVLSVAGHALN